MTAPVPIANTDCTSADLHEIAKRCNNARQALRLRAIAMVLDGASRQAAARACGTTRQSIRDWVLRCNAQGPDGLCDRPIPGRPPRWTPEIRETVGKWLDEGPDPEIDKVCRWRLVDIRNKVQACFGIGCCLETIRRLVRSLKFGAL